MAFYPCTQLYSPLKAPRLNHTLNYIRGYGPSHRSGQHNLVTSITICTTYANEHHLIYNTKKSVVITFKQRRWKHSNELDVFLNANRLPNKEERTHLGVVINCCCMVQSTLEARKRKFYVAVNGVISRLGGSCPKDSVWMTIMERQLFPVLA